MSISTIVITKNEELMIANCLETLRWCDEIIVVDSGSTDRTVGIAERGGALVVQLKSPTFAQSRNAGKEKATGDWVFYVDADERVTPQLKKEIDRAVRSSMFAAYAVPRNNIHYGKWMRAGGWQNDKVVRLFKKDALVRWEGEVHEHAIVQGETGELKDAFVHLTHRNMRDGLEKSIVWTDTEAKLLYETNHPKMSVLRLIKVTVWELLRRVVFQRAFKDGTEGMIEAMTQAMNRFLVYERLWEFQRRPSLEETYKKIEKEIAALWKKSSA